MDNHNSMINEEDAVPIVQAEIMVEESDEIIFT
jgi:hypothetical protein